MQSWPLALLNGEGGRQALLTSDSHGLKFSVWRQILDGLPFALNSSSVICYLLFLKRPTPELLQILERPGEIPLARHAG